MRNKFGAKKTIVDGQTFDSAAEARRWAFLRVLELAGEITDLKRQPVFPLVCACGCEVRTSRKSIAKFTADLSYRDKSGELHIEDVKGVITEAARLRIAVVEALYHIKIEIVRRK